MNLARVARLLAAFVAFFTAAQFIPFAFACFEPRAPFDTLGGFGGSLVIGGAVALLMALAGRGADREFHRREGLAVVTFAWMLASVLGGVPFVWSGALHSGADAVFESVSGLTTTGASVLGGKSTPTIESLPRSLLFWRAQLQFVGGIGIVLVFIVLLPAIGVTGKSLLTSEQTGVATDISEPRMLEQARGLFRCYVALNVLCALAFWLTGQPPFDAVCHALATVSTGGYSTRNLSLGAYDSAATEVVGTVFMFLGGCNFAWMVGLVRRGSREASRLWHLPELRCYLITLAVATLFTAASLWLARGPLPEGAGTREYSGLLRCLRDASFNVVSMFTSTGFATADFQNWPALPLLVLLYGMLVGACTGSTAGGIKMLRVLVSAKLATFHGRRFMRPKSVERLKLGGDVVADPVVSAVLAMVVLWLAVVGIGAVVFATCPGLDAQSCLTASASLTGNTGPALTAVMVIDGRATIASSSGMNLGPYGSFGDLPPYLKVWGSFLMLLGRLEIVALLVLFSPRFWRG